MNEAELLDKFANNWDMDSWKHMKLHLVETCGKDIGDDLIEDLEDFAELAVAEHKREMKNACANFAFDYQNEIGHASNSSEIIEYVEKYFKEKEVRESE